MDTTVLTTAINSMSADITGALTVVVPVALAITGAYLAYKKGISFFKGLVK